MPVAYETNTNIFVFSMKIPQLFLQLYIGTAWSFVGISYLTDSMISKQAQSILWCTPGTLFP